MTRTRCPGSCSRGPLSGGRTDGLALDPAELDGAITQYFEQAGWDVETGVPRRETLEEVGLGWVAGEITAENNRQWRLSRSER